MDKKIRTFISVCRITREEQQEGKRVVFVHGIFDILHRGHIEILTRAKKLGDVLVVGVDCDYNARALKGSNRPINRQESRMYVLSHIDAVDYVFVIPQFDSKNASEFYTEEIYKKLKPNIVASCIKAGKYGYVKKLQAEEVGVKFVDINRGIYKIRTTQIAKILGLE